MAEQQAQPGVGGNPASSPSPRRWYAYVGGQNYGPYSGRDIERMLGSGQILATDFLCIEGGSAWTPAADEPAFAALFQARGQHVPPPPPRVTADDTFAALAADHVGAPQPSGGALQAASEGSEPDKTRQDLREFFGPRADQYLAIYDKMQADKRFVGRPNWLVLFTSFPWFFYRRMYVTGVLVILVPALASYLFGITANVGVAVALSMMANRLYVYGAVRRLKKADTLGLAGEERRDYLRRAGGVSIAAGVLAGVLFVAAVAAAVLAVYLKHRKAAH